MSYTVLARKYRSPNFEDVVGQTPVLTTLRNAITGNRVHHAYLFCGTRGVGKTSLARILAKSLNCLSSDGPTIKPCGKCDSCKGISEGEDIDVIEIDAASNTGVDNIRELRGNAVYRPARSRFKIYIIDEVHMLSTGAFNALLKTLEEPPPHVKFILATTDPQKVPATIQSRCQRFEFRPVPADLIASRLAYICKQEKVEADAAAIKRVARLANGSIRDGVSLLDQLLSVCGSKLTAEAADEFLPAAHDERLTDLIDKLAESDAAGALKVADASLGEGQTADQWCVGLIAQMRDLMVMRLCGADTDLVDVPATLRARLGEQAMKFEAQAYVFIISVLEELRRAVRYSGASRALIEAAIVRLADTGKFASIEAVLGRLEGGAGASGGAAGPGGAARPAVRPVAAAASEPAMTSRRTDSAPVQSAAEAEAKKKEPVNGDATDADARPAAVPPKVVRAAVSAPQPAVRAPAAGPRAVGRPRSEDMAAAMNEPAVRDAMEVFDGQLVNVQRMQGA